LLHSGTTSYTGSPLIYQPELGCEVFGLRTCKVTTINALNPLGHVPHVQRDDGHIASQYLLDYIRGTFLFGGEQHGVGGI
jgi:hypothetical protein